MIYESLSSVCSEFFLFDHAVESAADFCEIGPQRPLRVIQMCQELRVGVMVKHVSDAIQRFRRQMLFHQLQQ